MTKISIITINYNDKKGLEKTIESVVNQTFKDFEFVVIDGGSTDGGKEVLSGISLKLFLSVCNGFKYWKWLSLLLYKNIVFCGVLGTELIIIHSNTSFLNPKIF